MKVVSDVICLFLASGPTPAAPLSNALFRGGVGRGGVAGGGHAPQRSQFAELVVDGGVGGQSQEETG